MIRFLITRFPAILFLLGAGSSALLAQKTAGPLAWPALRQEHKPWAYWWWMGSAVDTNNLTRLLETYRDAGFGGMHIIPIYGVRGEEKRFIEYLSPQWMGMLAHTVAEGKRLGFGVDMTLGSGWNFGGPQVAAEDAPVKVVWQTYSLNAGQRLTNYVKPFDAAFRSTPGTMVRAFYHDSYEYHNTTWCDDFLDQFQHRRGYDLRQHLPALLGEGSSDNVARVRCDYRETIADLHLEEYIMPWAEWARAKGARTRNQAHGSPANLIDVYAAADIPETEIFHSSRFDIPGLHQDDYDFDRPTPAMMRFASSAAHVAGRTLVASETCTWLTEHFQETLALVKPELDQLFVNGINHVFYHGVSYSPTHAEWPGWLFYASTHFGPSGALWRNLPALNLYAARCQAVLQSGVPDNDVLLYYPVFDLWQQPSGLNERFGDLVMPTQVHYLAQWLLGTPFHQLQTKLAASGRGTDYVSDRYLRKAKVNGGRVSLGGQEYQAIVMPQCAYLPPATLRRIIELADSGATVVFDTATPSQVPGLGGQESREKELQQLLAQLQWKDFASGTAQVAKVGQGCVFKTENVAALLSHLKVRREPMVETGLQFIRRKHDAGSQLGTIVTRPLVFSGSRLVLNVAAKGTVRVGLLDESGQPLKDYALAACDPIRGDSVRQPVTWRGRANVRAQAGKVVRLQFELQEAKLYAFEFTNEK